MMPTAILQESPSKWKLTLFGSIIVIPSENEGSGDEGVEMLASFRGFSSVSFTSIGIILFSGGTGSLTVDLSVRPNWLRQ